MTTSYSKCPSHYVRPNVLVLHGESGWIRDIALYLASQLALGGYTQLQVAPCLSSGDHSKMTVKQLKQFLRERGIDTSRACERSDLLELAKKHSSSEKIIITSSHQKVVPYSETRKRRPKVASLYDIDLKVCDSFDQVDLTSARTAMVIVCTTTKDEARAAGHLIAKHIKANENDTMPIVFLAPPGPVFYDDFEACFEDEDGALPVEKSNQDDPDNAMPPRNLDGHRVVVRAACGFCVGRRDQALIALSGGGKIALERLDKEREISIAKFYDLLASAMIPILYVQRANLTTVTWGGLLVSAPLIVAATAASDTYTYRESLSSNRELRIIAADALREVRLHMNNIAQRVRRKADLSHTDTNDKQKKKKKIYRLWRPAVDIGQHLAFARALEWTLCSPDILFSTLVAPFILAAPFHTSIPDCAHALIPHLRTAIGQASPSHHLDRLEGLLNQSDTKKKNTSRARSVIIMDFVFVLASVVLIFLSLAFLCLVIDLSYPDISGRAARAFFASNGGFDDDVISTAPASQPVYKPYIVPPNSEL